MQDLSHFLSLFSQSISYLVFQEGVSVVGVTKVDSPVTHEIEDPEIKAAVDQVRQFCEEAGESQLTARDQRASDTKQTFCTQQQHALSASIMGLTYSSDSDSHCGSVIYSSDSEDEFEQPPIKISKKN